MICQLYLNVAEVTSGTLSVEFLRRNELATNVLAVLSESSSGVNMETVTSGLEAVDNTTDLDGAVDGGLLQHDLAVNVHTFNGNEGPAGSLGNLGPGSAASDSNNYKKEQIIVNLTVIFFLVSLTYRRRV